MRVLPRATSHRAWALLPLALVLAGASAPGTIALDSILAYLGFDAAAKQELLAGQIVSRRIQEGQERTELAISVAGLFSASLEEAQASVVRGDVFEVDRNVIEFGALSAWPPDPAEFAGVQFSAAEASDVTALLRFDGGSDFNLSREEIARFRKLAGQDSDGSNPAAREAVSAAYREVLLGRYRAYREKGLAGLAPYDRGKGRTIDPSETLRLAAGASRFFQENEPALHKAFVGFPAGDAQGVEHFFYWIKQSVEGRPNFILSHRMLARRPGHAVVAERQYFVGHSFNTVQIVNAALPVEAGIAVVYTSRTSIDQMAGVTGKVARPIAAGRVADRVRARFEAIRAREGAP
jgi:hypothetical protein